MEFRYLHKGKIKGGKLSYGNPLLLQKHLISLEGEDVEILIRKRRIPATSEQMSFYVGVILKEAHKHEHFAHYNKPKDIHDLYLEKIFLKEYTQSGGEKIKKLNELNKEEMWELTERVIAFLLLEHDIEIGEKHNYYVK